MPNTSRKHKRGRQRSGSDQLQRTIEVIQQVRSGIVKFHRNVVDTIKRSEEPHCEITQNSAQMKIFLTLPDVKRKNITVRVFPLKIDVCGRKKNVNLLKTIDIPTIANTEKMRASFNGNRLKITLPYKMETPGKQQ